MSKLERVGFIGLGHMGVGMAANVLKAGYPLTVLGNKRRAPVEHLVSMGAREASSAADLAGQCDIVLLCVTTSEVVEKLINGPAGLLAGLRQPLLVIDCGTSKPDSTRALGATLAERGCSMMDVPLGRSAAAAEAGTLNMMAGGAKADFDRARPLLQTMSENLFHLGELGLGHSIKLINNAYSMSVACLVAEAVQSARAAGVDVALLNQVMAAGPNRSDFFDWMMCGPLEGDETRLQFSINNGLKDVNYFLDLARNAGVQARVPEAARAVLHEVVERGEGADPVPALCRHLATPVSA